MCYANRLKGKGKEREREREEKRKEDWGRVSHNCVHKELPRSEAKPRANRSAGSIPYSARHFHHHFSLFIPPFPLAPFFLFLSPLPIAAVVSLLLPNVFAVKRTGRCCVALRKLVSQLQHASRIKLIAIYGYAPSALLRHIIVRCRGIYRHCCR